MTILQNLLKVNGSQSNGNSLVPGRGGVIPLTVLVVVEGDVLRELWASVLAPWVGVRAVSTTSEALAAMDEHCDILLLDWKLGKDTGDTVLSRWVQMDCGPVCVVSGVMSVFELQELYQRGVTHAFVKPLPVASLTAAIRHCASDVLYHRQVKSLREEISRLRRDLWKLAACVIILAAASAPAAVDTLIPLVLQLLS